MPPRPRWSAAVFVTVVALPMAALTRLWGLTFCLPHPHCRPDEDAVTAIVGGFRDGNFNPPVFTYPPLFMLAVAAVLTALPHAERLLHKLMPFHFDSLINHVPLLTKSFMAARLLSASAGIASVWVLFRAGSRLFDRTAAAAGATFLALAFLHVRDSHFGVTDVPMSFMVLVAFACAVRLAQTGTRRDLIVAGLAAGLAAATKYNGGLVALPVLFAIVICPPAERTVASRIGGAAVAIAMMMIAFLGTSPYTVIEFPKFLSDFRDASNHLTGGHGVNLGRGWIYHATTTLRYGVGAPMLVGGVAGLGLLVYRSPANGILAALFPVAYYAVLGAGYTVFARHMTPIVPFLCLGAGYLAWEIAGWIAARIRRPAWRMALTAAAVAVMVWPSLVSIVKFDTLIARTDSRMLARIWIEQRFKPGTTIAQLGPMGGHVFLHYEPELVFKTVNFSLTQPRPDIVVVQSSQLIGPPELGELEPVLRAEYTRAYSRAGAADDPRNVYDRQDEFYLPFGGFHVTRAGPNLEVYVRNDLNPTR